MMGVIATVGRWLGFGGVTSDSRGPQNNAPALMVADGLPRLGIDGALQIAAVYACVALYVRNVGTMEVIVYRETGEAKVEDKLSGLWSLMHDRPNPRMVAVVFWQTMLLNLLFRGNAYARLDRGDRGEVIAMWPMAADQVEPWVLDDGSVVYRYVVDGGVAVLAAENVLHIKDIGNGTVGLSRLDLMRATTTEAINAQSHANKTFANAGKAAGILMVDKVLSDKQRQQIRESFGDVATGPMSRLFILEAAMKYQPVGMTPADVQLLQTREFSVQEIGRWFGVPAALINAVDMTNHADLVDSWFKLQVRPLLELIEQTVEAQVLTAAQRARYCVEFNFESLLRASLKDRMAIHATAVQNGIYSRDEARRQENLPPVAGGAVLTAQSNLVPLSMLGSVRSGSVPADPIKQ